MANKPEDTTIEKTQNSDLTLTGKPVLIQNNIGIFYGFLEKSDTRSGTALLRDAFKLSPERHITFSQYLDFLSNEMSDRYWEAENEFTKSFVGDEDVQPDGPPPDEDDIIPNEILIDQDTFEEHLKDLSITDYASEGVYLVQKRTSTHENSNNVQSTAPLISITNVIAIVAISEQVIKHNGLAKVQKEIEDNGLISDVGLYYDALTPMITFGLIDSNLQTLITYTNLEAEKSDSDSWDKVYDLLGVTPTMKYMAKSIAKQVESYLNPELFKGDIKLSDFINTYLIELIEKPLLIVNSNQRINLFKKKAQSDEQID
jgi:hypothetical protein